MNSIMPDEAGFVHVRFPTLAAFVRSFSSVKSLMPNKGAVMFEIFPTFTASERLLSSVNFDMLIQGSLLDEGFLTFPTLKRLFSSVYPPVSKKQRLKTEGLATVAAFEVPLLTVNNLFFSQCSRVALHYCESRDAQEARRESGGPSPCLCFVNSSLKGHLSCSSQPDCCSLLGTRLSLHSSALAVGAWSH